MKGLLELHEMVLGKMLAIAKERPEITTLCALCEASGFSGHFAVTGKKTLPALAKSVYDQLAANKARVLEKKKAELIGVWEGLLRTCEGDRSKKSMLSLFDGNGLTYSSFMNLNRHFPELKAIRDKIVRQCDANYVWDGEILAFLAKLSAGKRARSLHLLSEMVRKATVRPPNLNYLSMRHNTYAKLGQGPLAVRILSNIKANNDEYNRSKQRNYQYREYNGLFRGVLACAQNDKALTTLVDAVKAHGMGYGPFASAANRYPELALLKGRIKDTVRKNLQIKRLALQAKLLGIAHDNPFVMDYISVCRTAGTTVDVVRWLGLGTPEKIKNILADRKKKNQLGSGYKYLDKPVARK